MTVLIPRSHLRNFTLATTSFLAIRSVHRRQTDGHTAENVLNIARNLTGPSRMLQGVATPISEQKTINTFLMHLAPIQCASASSRSRTSFPSEASVKHLTSRAILHERRKFEEERLRKEEEKQTRKDIHLSEKSKKRAKNTFLV